MHFVFPSLRFTGSGLAATALGLVVTFAGSPSPAAIEALNVQHLGAFPVTDYDPWVADVWGFTDGQGREFALLCSGNKLRILDCTDPANIIEASAVAAPPTGDDLKDVKGYGSYAYACQEYGDVLIVDISDPYAATQVGAIPQEDICYPNCSPGLGGCHNLWIDERGYLFLAGVHWDATLIYDLNANPTDPPQVHVYDPGYIHDLYVKNGIGYLANPETDANEWEIVDFSNVLSPVRLGGLTHDGVHYAHACWATDDGSYLLTSDEGAGGHLFVFDIRDPANAFPIAEYEAGSGSSIHNIQIVGDLAYIAYYDQGLRVLDVGDPSNPVEVGIYRDDLWQDGSCSFSVYRGLWGIYAFAPSGRVYVSEMCGGGLHVLAYTGSPTGLDPDPADRIRLAVTPNPSHDPVRIEAELEAAGPIRLEVFGADGRRIRTLEAGSARHGLQAWTWDGRDDLGAPVGPGVYYVRLEQGRRARTEKVVRID